MGPIRKLVAVASVAALMFASPAHADGIMGEPLPRFQDRLCPGVIGLEQEFAELVVTRLRMNAERFGLRLAEDGGCEPNLVVAVVDDSKAYLADLVERRGYLFRDMDPADRERMLTAAGPVGVWHQTAARTRDGIRVGRRENLTQPPEAGMWQAHSRIYRPVRHDITYALVLLDIDSVRGLTLRQLADFATLRALATEYPDEAGQGEASMLTLFDETAARPEELTAFDTAWLTSLYSGMANIPASIRLRSVQVAENE
ncbi:hypothetical protein [Aurantiacibacter poecillastricola]|uniref:hypothetical protein n=1 Tax=Aurantiacibacter poecillastricola TaxID=3064385 RepID=UPI00273D64C4|nr:hypothetical protein [Aurantiacibacter sp. 219JJ12-13]MDP5260893.1 hypothetical protein [Aurantiacibacter sp. 219JJ12-13]